MKYQFAEKIKNLKPSAIREILKNSNNKDSIPFSAGNPAYETFPVNEIIDISNEILLEKSERILQYSITEGYYPLREYISKKFQVDIDNVIITSGAQQAINLSTRILCNEGDCILCEEPTFVGAINAFKSYGANVCGISIESDGINIAELEQKLTSEQNVRFIYTIPNFQNPTGITMSLEKRTELYDIAKRHNVLILEDNPYGDLRFSGSFLPTVKSFDKDGLVIYVGSLSKVLSPGIRVGYAIAPAEIIQKMISCKQCDDVHTNVWAQLLVYRFLQKYSLEEHLRKIRIIYKQKSELAMQMIDKYLAPKGVKYTHADGGLFTWCTLPQNVDMLEFCKKALENNVCVVPGNTFLIDDSHTSHSFRINFSAPTEQQIILGIKALAQIL